MGWWATTILGGDEPFDLLDDLTSLLGLGDNRWFHPTDDTKKAVESFGVDRYVEFINTSAPYSSCVAAQVVALVHMGSGVRLPDVLCELAINACRNGHIGWDNPKARQAKLDEFAVIIKQHREGVIPPLQKRHFEEMLGV